MLVAAPRRESGEKVHDLRAISLARAAPCAQQWLRPGIRRLAACAVAVRRPSPPHRTRLDRPHNFSPTRLDTTQDIEARLKALEASEKRLRLITANVPAMIAYIDSEERYQFVNPTVELWYGVSRRAYPGRTVREMRGERAYAEIRDYMRRALNGQTVSYQRVTHEGTMPRHVEVKYIPDMGSDGKVAGFYVMITDI